MDKIQFPLTTVETLDILGLLVSTEDNKIGSIVFEKKIVTDGIELKLQVVSDDADSWMWIVLSDKCGKEISCTEQIFDLELSEIKFNEKYTVRISPFSDALYPRLSTIKVGSDYNYGVIENIFTQENSIRRQIDAVGVCESEESEDCDEFEMLDATTSGADSISVGESFLVVVDESRDAVLSFVLTGYSNTTVWTCCYRHDGSFKNCQ